MNCEETIKKGVKLFTKERYFYEFSRLLEEAESNLHKSQNHYLLTNNLEVLETITSKGNNKATNNNKSPWYTLMELILYSKDNHLFNPNSLFCKYLKKLSNMTIKKLLSISLKCKQNLNECVKIYLKLCEEKIYGKRRISIEKIPVKKEVRNALLKRLTTFVKVPLIRSTLKREEIKNLLGNKKPSSKPKVQKHKMVLDSKNNKNNTFLYCNSFTHLFIGETDEESVKERYLSNIIVKNEQRLNIHGSYVDLSAGYLKQLYRKITKQNQIRETNPNIENTNSNKKLIEIQKIFKKDYRKIECLKNKEKINSINIYNNSYHYNKTNFSDRGKKSHNKFLYPSIINFKKSHFNLFKSKEKDKIKEIKPLILKNKLNNEYINKYYLYSDRNNKTNNVNFFKNHNLKDFYFYQNLLSDENSINSTISKDKKSIKIPRDKSNFNQGIKNKDRKIKKKLLFSSIYANGDSKDNSFNKNTKNKILKNFLDKKDFFFDGL